MILKIDNSNAIEYKKEEDIKKGKKIRSSNIELLRFLLACFVIIIHYCHRLFQDLFLLCGAVNCFAIISGYFLVKNKDDFRFLKFLPTILFLEIVNLLLYVIFNFSTSYRILHTPKDWISMVEYGLGTWWYIWAILIVYIFSPFLNYGLQCLGAKKSAFLIASLWAWFQISSALEFSYKPFGYYWGSLIILIYGYLLGGFLKLYGQNFLQNKVLILSTGISFFICAGILNSLYVHVYPNANPWLGFSSENNSLFAFPIAFYLFAFFNLIKMKSYKFINFLGSLSLFTFAFQNSCLDFSTVLIQNIHSNNREFYHSWIALGLLSVISFSLYYPYKFYDFNAKKVVQKISSKLSGMFKENKK